jgi:hypothetical protein
LALEQPATTDDRFSKKSPFEAGHEVRTIRTLREMQADGVLGED